MSELLQGSKISNPALFNISQRHSARAACTFHASKPKFRTYGSCRSDVAIQSIYPSSASQQEVCVQGDQALMSPHSGSSWLEYVVPTSLVMIVTPLRPNTGRDNGIKIRTSLPTSDVSLPLHWHVSNTLIPVRLSCQTRSRQVSIGKACRVGSAQC